MHKAEAHLEPRKPEKQIPSNYYTLATDQGQSSAGLTSTEAIKLDSTNFYATLTVFKTFFPSPPHDSSLSKIVKFDIAYRYVICYESGLEVLNDKKKPPPFATP